MVKRVLAAVVGLPLIVVILYFLPDVATAIALSALCAIALYEALVTTGFLMGARVVWYSILFAALVPLWVYFDSDPDLALAGLFVYVTALFCDAIQSRKKIGLEQMGGAFFLSLFIPYFLSSFIRLRAMDEWGFYVALPFVAAFLSDACAYFVGMALGKHKLAPDLSPKKTVEGAAGGLIGATVGTVLAGVIFHGVFPERSVSYLAMALYGALGSILSQLGDLSFSYLKREYGIKDFGHILPGHGGILDRFDSVIFCAPLMELLIRFLPVVN